VQRPCGWDFQELSRILYFIFRSNEPDLSKFIDAVLALMFAPGLTFIAIAGWVRALMSVEKRHTADRM
jgi:hypothetical protein